VPIYLSELFFVCVWLYLIVGVDEERKGNSYERIQTYDFTTANPYVECMESSSGSGSDRELWLSALLLLVFFSGFFCDWISRVVNR